jgi:hypothetical protein
LQTLEKYSNIKSHENPTSGAELFHAGRQAGMKKPFLTFRYLVNEVKYKGQKKKLGKI